MKKIIVALATTLLLGLVMLALAACGGGSGGGAGGGSDDGAVRSVLQKQLGALRNKDWSGAYKLYSPSRQSACSYDAFLAYISSPPSDLNAIDTSKFDYVDVKVSIEGETASTTYVQKYGGTLNGNDVPDKAGTLSYQKINGSWYINGDPCGEIDNSAPSVTGSATATATSAEDSSTTPSPAKTIVNGATFAVEVDGMTSEVRDAKCTRSAFGVDIDKGLESFSLAVDPPTGGEDITKGLIQFTTGGIRYAGNVVGEIAADLESGTFSGTFLEPDRGLTAEVTGSFTC